MRIILFLLAFLFSQKPSYLQGDYYETEHGMIGASWHFEKDGTFTYSEANCEGGTVGNGIYKLESDSVHFIFQAAATSNIASKLEAIKQQEAVQGWRLDFRLKERETDEPVMFAVIVAKDSAGNILQGVTSDFDGKAVLKIPNHHGSIFIAVQYVGFATAELKLKSPGSYLIKGTMSQAFGPSGVPAGTRYDYRLLSIGKKGMKWQTSYTDPDTTVVIEVKRIKKH
jgi:hypothetical protein